MNKPADSTVAQQPQQGGLSFGEAWNFDEAQTPDAAEVAELRKHGFILIPDYLSEQEQDVCIQAVDRGEWLKQLKRRRVQHYGWRYDYAKKNITRDSQLGPLPRWAEGIAQQLHIDGHFEDRPPDQMIVNEYEHGQTIAMHTDRDCFGPVVATISLLGVRPMRLKYEDWQMDIWLPIGSLLVMKGAARYKWKHGLVSTSKMLPRRISLTFRTIYLLQD